MLSAKVRYSIEKGYDYAYVLVDGTKVSTNLSNSSVVSEGIDGHSTGWATLTANLPAGSHSVGFGYFTDGGVQGDGGGKPGIAVDDIAITGQPVDGAETDAGWKFASNSDTGFHVTTGLEKFKTFNFYVAENRQYLGYDANLDTGPYNFATDTWAERFAYQDGMLVWYSDYFWGDNGSETIPVRAWSCRSMLARTSCTGRTTGRTCADGSSRSTRRSARRRRRSRCSTTTWRPRSRRRGP